MCFLKTVTLLNHPHNLSFFKCLVSKKYRMQKLLVKKNAQTNTRANKTKKII